MGETRSDRFRRLRVRSRVYRRMAEEEQRDTDDDGIPDVYQQHEPGQGSAR